MKYTFIYPADYFDAKQVDESFKNEANLLSSNGHQILTFSVENPKKWVVENNLCIYRGWMLSKEDYELLSETILKSNGVLLTSKEQYFSSHYLPNWYKSLKDFTPETIVIEKAKISTIKAIAENSGWSDFFVKDYVKSLTTSEGSIAKSIDELCNIVNKIDTMRSIEGGICIRHVESFVENTEVRFFVFKNNIYAPDNIEIPDIAFKVMERIDLPFFSIDIIKDKDGKSWLVEIGDGQVSSFKSPWSNDNILSIFQD